MKFKWLNRFGFLSVFLFSILVMCVVGTYITREIKTASGLVSSQFVEDTKTDIINGINIIF